MGTASTRQERTNPLSITSFGTLTPTAFMQQAIKKIVIPTLVIMGGLENFPTIPAPSQENPQGSLSLGKVVTLVIRLTPRYTIIPLTCSPLTSATTSSTKTVLITHCAPWVLGEAHTE
jgi:hypothetical protein